MVVKPRSTSNAGEVVILCLLLLRFKPGTLQNQEALSHSLLTGCLILTVSLLYPSCVAETEKKQQKERTDEDKDMQGSTQEMQQKKKNDSSEKDSKSAKRGPLPTHRPIALMSAGSGDSQWQGGECPDRDSHFSCSRTAPSPVAA